MSMQRERGWGGGAEKKAFLDVLHACLPGDESYVKLRLVVSRDPGKVFGPKTERTASFVSKMGT